MSIFRRRSDSGTAGDVTADNPESDDTSAAPPDDEGTQARADGPYDEGDVDDIGERIDLGGMWVPTMPGMELRVEMKQGTQEVTGVHVVVGDSALQLQAFAAPRSSGLWDEIRREIGESIRSRGGTAELAQDEFGTELRARMPQSGADGRTVFAPARFVGVDGSRWFLRAVYSGRAAIDEEAARPLTTVLRGVVIRRGEGPMAPRELLPLHLPQRQQAGEDTDTPGGKDLSPFERGPEITEVR